MTNDELLKRAAELETTAAAMRLVAEHGPEKCIVEVGEGGGREDWYVVNKNCQWNGPCYRATLKPQPRYEPFTRDDWRQIIGRIVRGHNEMCMITQADADGATLVDVHFPYVQLCQEFTFADTNTPCGKLVSQ